MQLRRGTAVGEDSGEDHVPGETGIWVLVFGEMSMFAVLFCTYAWYRAQHPQLYLDSQASLSRTGGVINTLLLLTSSWFVALGVRAVRGRQVGTARMFALAFACGAAFATVKFFEYRQQLVLGHSPASNEFYAFYFVLTGLHLVHVLIGMIVLTILWRKVRGGKASLRFVESGATYWHMVDLVWVVLFPLLYLIR